jgi:hypothetical protein
MKGKIEGSRAAIQHGETLKDENNRALITMLLMAAGKPLTIHQGYFNEVARFKVVRKQNLDNSITFGLQKIN